MSSTHISDREIKVRKQHRCRVCDEAIPGGAICHEYRGVDSEDGFYTIYFHLDCWDYSRDWDDNTWDSSTPGSVSHEEVRQELKEAQPDSQAVD